MRNRHAPLRKPPVEAAVDADTRLCVHVIATTDVGTRRALAAAAALAGDLRARLVLLVPHVVPYAQALDHPADPPAWAGERYRDAAAASALNVTIRVCVCRTEQAVIPLLPRNAVVVMARPAHRWGLQRLARFAWKTRDERLARAIECGGRRVLRVE
jgi:hypothetical protein